jgi:hypothetical protein
VKAAVVVAVVLMKDFACDQAFTGAAVRGAPVDSAAGRGRARRRAIIEYREGKERRSICGPGAERMDRKWDGDERWSSRQGNAAGQSRPMLAI